MGRVSRSAWAVWILSTSLVAAIGALLLWPSVGLWSRMHRGVRAEVADLVEAVGERRPIEGRLSGGFRWGLAPDPVRATRSGMSDTPSDLWGAVARIAERATSGQPGDLAALGTAHLAIANVEPALSALEQAVALDNRSAFAWSDLSAAYLARAKTTGSAVDIARALEAAERALALDTEMPEALFNRALALERLGMAHHAIEAWKAAGAFEGDHTIDERWADEAHARAKRLEETNAAASAAIDLQAERERLFDDVLPRWGQAAIRRSQEAGVLAEEATAIVQTLEATPEDRFASDVIAALKGASNDRTRDLLARGHEAYGHARRLYKENRMDDAAEAFRQSADLLGRRSPLGLAAQVYSAFVAYRRSDVATAERDLSMHLPRLTAASYPSLAGRAAWTLGVIHTQRGAYSEAADFYRQAQAAFAASAEKANEAFIYTLLADNYDRRGDPERGWNERVRGLSGNRREGALLTAAQSAQRLELHRVAVLLQQEAVSVALAYDRPINRADALRVQAQTRAQLGEIAEAARLLEEAYDLATFHQDSTWDRIRAELDLASAQVTVLSGDHSSRADALIKANRAHDYFVATHATRRRPDALLARASLHRMAGQIDAARADLNAALESLSAERDRLPSGAERLVFAETAARVTEALVSLEIDTGSAEAALAAADWPRSWDLGVDRAPGTAVAELKSSLPADIRVLYYMVGSKRSFVWQIARGSIQVFPVAATRSELRRLIGRGNPEDVDSPGMQAVFDRMVQPVFSSLPTSARLVVVPDGPLHAVPFAALPGRRTQYLIEEHALAHAPSLTALTVEKAWPFPHRPASSIVAVGNPSIPQESGSNLPDLPAAAHEAQIVAREYPFSRVLVARDATTEALAAAIPEAEVLHFAGHAIADDLFPENSQLAIADSQGRLLRAGAIRQWPLSRLRLAVLAACGSAGGTTSRSQGPVSLARTLLQAGVQSVLANRWTVADRAAAAMSESFHRHYRDASDAPEALRQAQIALIRSRDPQMSDPTAWAGWTLIGTGFQHAPRPSTDKENR